MLRVLWILEPVRFRQSRHLIVIERLVTRLTYPESRSSLFHVTRATAFQGSCNALTSCLLTLWCHVSPIDPQPWIAAWASLFHITRTTAFQGSLQGMWRSCDAVTSRFHPETPSHKTYTCQNVPPLWVTLQSDVTLLYCMSTSQVY